MAYEVVMPQMGADMKEGRLVRWLKAQGDPVSRGEPIAEIETDKAIVAMEAFEGGILGRIIAQEGDIVPVGRVVALIVAPGEAVPEVKAPVSAAAPVAPAPSPAAAEEAGRLLASPAARRLAQERGVALGQVRGTGPQGRITSEDVEAYLKPASTTPSAPDAPSSMRAAIARRMAQSKREAPHFYLTVEVDMGAALAQRESLNRGLSAQEHITVTDLLVKAAALALGKFPQFNASYLEGKRVDHPATNIGIAIALPEGLIAPAVLDCAHKSLAAIAAASKDLAERSRGGVLKPEEYTGATFTVSNLGMFGVESFVAIIPPPQAAILAVGAVRPTPVVRGAQIVVAQTMKATLSADHRLVDGAEAARFLGEIKAILEEPVRLLG
ncbi:MAG: 2-oxo acid dehydrogenase subunit E2 [Chloroflexi bacterium]|nr:2-oxo acid dehydrogenase subunit E2 [Chloroflexota bacterium]